MQITEIKVFPVGEEKLKAFVSVVIDSCFMVNDIKVIQGKDGMFISMPSRRKKNGRFKDIAHPLNNDTRQMMEREILSEYRLVVEGNGEQELPPESEIAFEVGAEEGREESAASVAPEAQQEETSKSEEPIDEKSLEEVTELHLRDSFWTT